MFVTKTGGKNLNKNDLVEAVAARANLKKKDAAAAVEAVLEAVTGTLGRGEEVRLPGFGSFCVRKAAARTGRNPRTGEEISIPARSLPAFRPGKELKEAVRVL